MAACWSSLLDEEDAAWLAGGVGGKSEGEANGEREHLYNTYQGSLWSHSFRLKSRERELCCEDFQQGQGWTGQLMLGK